MVTKGIRKDCKKKQAHQEPVFIGAEEGTRTLNAVRR